MLTDRQTERWARLKAADRLGDDEPEGEKSVAVEKTAVGPIGFSEGSPREVSVRNELVADRVHRRDELGGSFKARNLLP